jgi:hypothetical protein
MMAHLCNPTILSQLYIIRLIHVFFSHSSFKSKPHHLSPSWSPGMPDIFFSFISCHLLHSLCLSFITFHLSPIRCACSSSVSKTVCVYSQLFSLCKVRFLFHFSLVSFMFSFLILHSNSNLTICLPLGLQVCLLFSSLKDCLRILTAILAV